MKVFLAVFGAIMVAALTGCNKEQAASTETQPAGSGTKVESAVPAAPAEGSGAKVETAPAMEGSGSKSEGSGTK
jgi:curli biogenesis system outer membrane secretion channel CsgG